MTINCPPHSIRRGLPRYLQLARVARYSEYEPGSKLFAVEACGPDGWGIPAWEELGLPKLAEKFDTPCAALLAIAREQL